jgi:hypothetical protein
MVRPIARLEGKMLVLLGPQGGLGWDNTQVFFRANWDEFRREAGWDVTPSSNFGSSSPPWPTFRCPACQRILPVDIAHVDHKQPRANLQFKVERADTLRRVPSFVQAGTTYTIQSEGSMGVVMTNTGQKDSAHYVIATGPMPAGPNVHGKRPGDDLAPPPAKRTAGPLPVPEIMPGLTRMTIHMPGTNRLVPKDIAEVLENDMSNLQLLCSYCNVAKGNRENWAFGAPHLGARV